MRPYAWTLYQPIDDALSRQDYIQALFLAQKLYMTDPANPVSSGYLCTAEFHSALYDKAAESCGNTLEAAESYPLGYPEQELNWIRIYYADSLRFQNRTRAAFDEYSKLESSKNLTTEQKCAMYINRSDLYAKGNDYGKAQDDIINAVKTCPKDKNSSKANLLLRQITGLGADDAILFAQRSQVRADLPPVEVLRKMIVTDYLKQFGAAAGKYKPKDTWSAEHINGPEYRVFLKSKALNPSSQEIETSDVFTVKINLWAKTGKVEKPMVLPAPVK